jgi:hypothetical protein
MGNNFISDDALRRIGEVVEKEKSRKARQLNDMSISLQGIDVQQILRENQEKEEIKRRARIMYAKEVQEERRRISNEEEHGKSWLNKLYEGLKKFINITLKFIDFCNLLQGVPTFFSWLNK